MQSKPHVSAGDKLHNWPAPPYLLIVTDGTGCACFFRCTHLQTSMSGGIPENALESWNLENYPGAYRYGSAANVFANGVDGR